jgi:hypothetical protein
MGSMFSRLARLALTVAVGYATSVANAYLSAGNVGAFDPIKFFTGRTHGVGELDTMLSSPVKVTVDSVGRQQGDTLTLDQTIREGDKPPRVRRWMMRRVAADRYTGTLTDAQTAVDVTVTGQRASIRYRMKGGLIVDQQLTLQSDGRTLLNRMKIKKFGLQVATVRETIKRVE